MNNFREKVTSHIFHRVQNTPMTLSIPFFSNCAFFHKHSISNFSLPLSLAFLRDSNWELFVSELKSLTTKLRALESTFALLEQKQSPEDVR